MEIEPEDTKDPTGGADPDLIDLQDPVPSSSGFTSLDETNLCPVLAEPDDHVTRDGHFHRAVHHIQSTGRPTRSVSSNIATRSTKKIPIQNDSL